MYMKFQKILMTGCRDMDKKHQKCPKNGGFPPFVTPQDFFFKNRALSLLYPYGALTSCKKWKKTNERSPRYLKTDGRTDKGDYYGPHRVNPRSKMSEKWLPQLHRVIKSSDEICFLQYCAIYHLWFPPWWKIEDGYHAELRRSWKWPNNWWKLPLSGLYFAVQPSFW